jgi:O-antigen/teichoic acid export membrane protein
MFARFKQYLSRENKNAVIVLTGTALNALVGGLFFIAAPRLIGPENYGLFAVVLSTGIMVSSFANLGVDAGILRFASGPESVKRQKVLKLAFYSYLVIGLAIFFLGFLVAQPLAEFFGDVGLTSLFEIAFFGSIVLLLTSFFTATLQAGQKFMQATIVSLSGNIARIVVLLLAAYFYSVNLYFLTILFFFIPIVSIITGRIFMPLDFLKVHDHETEFKSFFGFNLWIAASLAIASFPIDNYLLLKFAGPIATGIYAAPFKLLSVVDQLAGNYSRVLAQKMGSIEKHSRVIYLLKNTAPIAIIVAAGFLVLAMLSPFVVRLLLGKSYLQSIPVFAIISVSSAFTFMTAIPASITLYYFKDPRASFYITMSIVVFWIVSSFLLIPPYAQIGASIAYLLTEVWSFLLFSGFVLLKFRKKD